MHALAQSYLQSKLQFTSVSVLRLKHVGDMERTMTRQEKGMWGSDREFGRVGRLTGLRELQQTREKESKKASQPQDMAGKSGSNKLCN